jgi:hypothetical protein
MEITRVIYSNILNKWYVQVNKCYELEIQERDAKILIRDYELIEINMFRWELIK